MAETDASISQVCLTEREGRVEDGIIASPYRMGIAEKLDRLFEIERLFSLDSDEFSQQSSASSTSKNKLCLHHRPVSMSAHEPEVAGVVLSSQSPFRISVSAIKLAQSTAAEPCICHEHSADRLATASSSTPLSSR